MRNVAFRLYFSFFELLGPWTLLKLQKRLRQTNKSKYDVTIGLAVSQRNCERFQLDVFGVDLTDFKRNVPHNHWLALNVNVP